VTASGGVDGARRRAPMAMPMALRTAVPEPVTARLRHLRRRSAGRQPFLGSGCRMTFGVTDAVEDVLQAPDAALRVLQARTGRMVGVPFTLLAGHESIPSMLSRAWIDTRAELFGMAVSAQRRTTDRTSPSNGNWSKVHGHRLGSGRPERSGGGRASGRRQRLGLTSGSHGRPDRAGLAGDGMSSGSARISGVGRRSCVASPSSRLREPPRRTVGCRTSPDTAVPRHLATGRRCATRAGPSRGVHLRSATTPGPAVSWPTEREPPRPTVSRSARRSRRWAGR
jgi:hypothetical protein